MRATGRALVLGVALLSLASSHAGAGDAYTLHVPSRAIRVVDGDTVAVGKRKVRLLEIDAPEVSEPRCAAEATLGRAAKQWLADRIKGASSTRILLSGDHDRYGRALGRLFVDGHDAGELMLRAGLAIEWKPGRAAWQQRQRHWCG